MPFLWTGVTFANFIDGGKTLIHKDLLNSEYKASVKMSESDLINFVGISESWHAFHESSKFQYFLLNFCLWNTIKFEIFICAFTFYCNDARMIFILFYWSCDWAIGSSIWSIFTDLSWYFRIFRFETTVIKKLLRT